MARVLAARTVRRCCNLACRTPPTDRGLLPGNNAPVPAAPRTSCRPAATATSSGKAPLPSMSTASVEAFRPVSPSQASRSAEVSPESSRATLSLAFFPWLRFSAVTLLASACRLRWALRTVRASSLRVSDSPPAANRGSPRLVVAPSPRSRGRPDLEAPNAGLVPGPAAPPLDRRAAAAGEASRAEVPPRPGRDRGEPLGDAENFCAAAYLSNTVMRRLSSTSRDGIEATTRSL